MGKAEGRVEIVVAVSVEVPSDATEKQRHELMVKEAVNKLLAGLTCDVYVYEETTCEDDKLGDCQPTLENRVDYPEVMLVEMSDEDREVEVSYLEN